MGLTAGLNMAVRGMMTASLKTTLSSQNITNADKAGYTRKELEIKYLTTNQGSTPTSGMVVGTTDRFMVKALLSDISAYQANQVVSDSLSYYATQLGNTDGNNSISSQMDGLYSALQYVATNPENAANKSAVIQTANSLTSSLRDLSNSIQNLRLQSEQKIASMITDINATLDRIDVLNQKVASTTSGDASMADYEDQRTQELQNLAGMMDIQYFYSSTNVLQIYTGEGQPLLLSGPQHLSYTQTNQVNGSTLYPAGFSPITLNGIDITTRIHDGALSGLIDLRDNIYVDEQQKLNEFTSVLKEQVNTLLNEGASIPPRTLMEGSLQGLVGATPFTALGSIRVAVTNQSGTVQNYTDINLAAMTNVNDVLAALNGVAGITATLNVDGELSIQVAPATNGVSINPLNSSVTSGTGQSFSSYFGLNDMFVGTTAEDVQVSDYLISNPDYLAIGQLSSSATLAAGDRGVSRGDGSIAQRISDILITSVSFNAAGDFAAQNNTLQGYAQSIISSAANKSDLAQKDADTTQQVYKTSSDLLTSKTGVNVDEETAKLLLYQNQYQAGAQVVKTIRDMLDALIGALR